MERRTSKPEYIEPLLKALRYLGSATEEELIDRAFLIVRARLSQADHIILANGEPRWRYQMQHMIDGLIESGSVLKKNGLLSLS